MAQQIQHHATGVLRDLDLVDDWGQLLAAHVMGAVTLWDHPALFDYQDRYLVEMRARGTLDWRLTWRDFYLELWDEYRDDY